MICKFCDDTKIIKYIDVNHGHLGAMSCQCPCVEIYSQKFKAQQYKSLAHTLLNTIKSTCLTIGRLMPSAITISNKASKFYKSQTKLIKSL